MAFLAYISFYVVFVGVCFYAVQNVQKTAFIDEIFHIPQAQKYCNGQFNEWDTKITTLPGLYIFSLLLQPFVSIFTGEKCSIISLRYCNMIFNIVNVILIYCLMNQINKDKETKKKSEDKNKKEASTTSTSLAFDAEPMIISLFPLLFFYSVLYYTEPGSVMFVLVSYLATVSNYHKLSAIFGAFAILFRQTNVVWVLFMAGITAAKKFNQIEEIEKVKTSADITDKLARFFVGVLGSAIRYLLVIQNLLDTIKLCWPYICTLCGFLLFVIFNGSIVVGDKSSHTAAIHAEQIFYFLSFTLCFAFPLLFTFEKINKFCKVIVKNPFVFAMTISFCIGLIIQHDYVHPYLLSDNRHYIFYVWRWFLHYKIVRIMLIPVYLFTIWSMNDLFNIARKTELWKLVYCVCCIASVVPQLLLESRYFLLPYLIFRVNISVRNWSTLFLEFLLYFTINVFTIFIFVNKTFYWQDIDEPQRIIW